MLFPDIKRIIGRKYDDESLLKYKDNTLTNFTIVRGENDLAAFQIIIDEKKVIISPEEASSEILKYLKANASSYLKETVSEAVISIPAYFSNAQRKATKKAAELAGLIVLKLVTEPTAGAIHYIRNKNINAKLLVFDWGGGTLDISLIQVNNKIFEVKAVYGDTLLGGRNIDDILFKYFYVPVSYFPFRYIRRLLHECIVLKEQLSIRNEVTKIMEYVDYGKDLALSMTRDQFETLTDHIFQQILNIIEVGLYDAGWNKDYIDTILLVGGSSRIPKVSKILESFFNIDKLKTDLNPDEAVACGASIQAALLKDKSQLLEKYHITEVTPLSLGLGSKGNLFFKYIERNSRLPVSKTRTVTTTFNNQQDITLEVYEGERKNCIYNNKLGAFTIKDLPPRRTGGVTITVKFNLDEDGILTVTATEEKNITKTNTLVVVMGEFRLNDHKVAISIKEAQKLKYEDDVFEQFVKEKLTIEEKCHHILYDINKISQTQREFVNKQCNQFLNEIEKLEFTDIEDLKGMFKVMYDSIADILKKSKMLELTN